jgi:PAS domain S-box-containing protein
MVYTPYAWSLFAAAILSASIALYARRYPETPAVVPFVWMMWLGVAWTLIYAFSILTVWYPARLALSMLFYLPARLIPPAVLAFAIDYTGHEKWLSRRNVAIGLAIPLIAIAASLTSPWHHLFRFDFKLDTAGPIAILHYRAGIIYIVSSAYQDLMVLAALALLLISLRDRALQAKNTILLFTGIFVTIFVEALFDFGITPIPGYNFAPSTIVVAGVTYLLALMRYRLFRFAHIARSTVFDNIADIAVVFDTHFRIIDFNGAARESLGLDPKTSRGMELERLKPEWRAFFESNGRASAFDERREVSVPAELGSRTVDLSISRIKDFRGKLAGYLFLLHDITELRHSEERVRQLLKEKELLLREVHHRIKNNMSVISSLLSLQSETVSDLNARRALQDARSRVHSMMVLYDRLYRSDGLGEFSIAEYLSPLIDQVIGTLGISPNVEVNKYFDDIEMATRSLFAIGIIANELITNAIKYAFPDNAKGSLTIGMKRRGEKILLWVEDDGGRFPEDKAGVLTKGFGLQVVQLMAQQIAADFSVETEGRTRFNIEFAL